MKGRYKVNLKQDPLDSIRIDLRNANAKSLQPRAMINPKLKDTESDYHSIDRQHQIYKQNLAYQKNQPRQLSIGNQIVKRQEIVNKKKNSYQPAKDSIKDDDFKTNYTRNKGYYIQSLNNA